MDTTPLFNGSPAREGTLGNELVHQAALEATVKGRRNPDMAVVKATIDFAIRILSDPEFHSIFIYFLCAAKHVLENHL